ncbi:MAG: hypothetical protein HZB53_06645 [Chloroflexi bacterium]|nr:hypothetical protein [Chloroflexota bacterium]
METGKSRRLARLFGHGDRCLIVAMDHAGFMDKPLKGLENPAPLIVGVVRAGAGALLVTAGTLKRCVTSIGTAGVWLSVDAQVPLLERAAEWAVRLGADGLKCMFYAGGAEPSGGEAALAALSAECERWGLPLMAEVIPGGFGAGAEARTPERIAGGARMAAEMGADVVKTFYTGDPQSFRDVARYAGVPVVVLGGERAATDRDLLVGVRGALDGGAAGIAIGRNVWQSDDPGGLVRALARLVYADSTVEEALQSA